MVPPEVLPSLISSEVLLHKISGSSVGHNPLYVNLQIVQQASALCNMQKRRLKEPVLAPQPFSLAGATGMVLSGCGRGEDPVHSPARLFTVCSFTLTLRFPLSSRDFTKGCLKSSLLKAHLIIGSFSLIPGLIR